MWCAVHNHNYMCHICGKGVLDANFNQAGDTRIPLPRKSLGHLQKLSIAKLDFEQVCMGTVAEFL